MLDLRSRPIRATAVDNRLWVPRPDDAAVLQQALKRGFNVALLADPGGGVTSLLNHLAADLDGEGALVAQVSARRHDTPESLLDAVAQRLERFDQSPHALRKTSGDDAVDAAYQRLLSAVPRGARSIVIVDDMPPRLGHAVFGRLRDELWQLEVQWVVGAHADDSGLLLSPPADAFFERVHDLTPLTVGQVQELLARRDPEGEIAPAVRRAIARASNGNPAAALRLAREAVEAPDPVAAVEQGTVIDQVQERLGRPAARLADELARRGSASPSDPEILRQLGWSRPRAYQVFSQLEKEGFVTASDERSGRPGRPRKMYRLRSPA